ncbi:MAG: Nitrile hydratase subunit beta [Pseudomonadota bacterium]|jgi:hypothetical protein
MARRHDFAAVYDERALTSLATLCVEKGVVVSESPAHPFPDAHAHGVAAIDEPTHDARLEALERWPNATEPAGVSVAVLQSDLSRRSDQAR